jgi:hypothetical protein
VRRTDRDLPPASGALWAFIVKKGSAFLPKRVSPQTRVQIFLPDAAR